MAATLLLFSKEHDSDLGPTGFVDGVSGLIMNLDTATYATPAAQMVEAAKALNATKSAAGTEEDTTGANIPTEFKHNYFDSVQVIGVPTGGTLATPNASIILRDVEFGGISDVQAAVS